MLGREPGDGIAGGVMVFEHGFKLLDEVKEGPNGDDSTRDCILLKSGSPGEGRSFGHVGQGKGDHFVVVIIHLLIAK